MIKYGANNIRDVTGYIDTDSFVNETTSVVRKAKTHINNLYDRVVGKDTNMEKFSFKKFAQDICNGCDLITGDENKLSTDDIIEACKKYGCLSVHDFSQVEIDGDLVGVVTFDELPDKFYWGGKAITDMVNALISVFGNEADARAAYATAQDDIIQIVAEQTKTKNNRDFTKITVK